jgi:S-methylmethionine-dependent homocysteine/selenocysteine methylase
VLEAAGLDKQFIKINSRALAAAHQARKRTARTKAIIAASLSCLPPNFDPQAWPDSATELAAYKELVSLFVNEGAELIILEMMQEPVHARLAAEAAARSGLPVWLGLSCRLNEAGQLAGYDFPSLSLDVTLDALSDFDFAVAAVMHSPPAAVVPALQLLRRRWPVPLGAWAETGLRPEAAPGNERSPNAADSDTTLAPVLTPEEYVEAAATWVQAGAQVLGGCCGTTPAHIATLRARWPAGMLDQRRRAVSQCGIKSCQDDRQ